MILLIACQYSNGFFENTGITSRDGTFGCIVGNVLFVGSSQGQQMEEPPGQAHTLATPVCKGLI